MILKGDCISVMKALKPNFVDAVVCDPPYGLEFMGKKWDKLWDKRKPEDHPNQDINSDNPNVRGKKLNPVMGLLNNPNYKASIEAQLWHTQWLTEAYRVLKPGGSMLVMGGTRTSHRLACAIEDSGFIIKDTLMWIYGSGFPKAQDLGKMIDKRMGKMREVIGVDDTYKGKKPNVNCYAKDKWTQENWKREIEITTPAGELSKHWDGFKVGGIKPAYEPIIWAVKPPEGSYVDNVLKHGVGAVNVDECRIGVESDDINKRKATGEMGGSDSCFGVGNKHRPETLSKGRFPANVILSHHLECVQVGMKRVSSNARINKGGINKGRDSQVPLAEHNGIIWGNPGSFETVESWDCHPDCAVRILDEQSGDLSDNKRKKFIQPRETSDLKGASWKIGSHKAFHKDDNGGASRFFYCAKASKGERNAGLEGMEKKECFNLGHKDNPGRNAPKKSYPRQNNHPTVKPIKLFEYLIKLVTRGGQIILDPFIGSGTTAIAAHNTGRKCIGIEKENEYLEIAKRRIDYWENQPKQMEIGI